MIRLENIQIRDDLNENEILEIACKINKLNFKDVESFYIFKKSIDARDKGDIYYNYTLDVKLNNENKEIYSKFKKVSEENVSLKIENIKLNNDVRPVIVGCGPAGLFAAITLIRNGIKPIIIEQGSNVEERKQKVDDFLEKGKLNPLSNVQFGEGGAGTFSDGKLTTGTHNPLCKNVLQEFVRYGAPEQILYINKPHIGTDNLVKIIANMRNDIIKNGGEFLFNTKVIDLMIKNNAVCGVVCKNDDIETEIKTNNVILAIGHSARDTFEMLYVNKINMEKKNFSVGVRIEHKQSMINKSQYGNTTKLKLPPAEYKLAYHGEERSCYTFCMCPGGVVMASSSEEGTIVTNGIYPCGEGAGYAGGIMSAAVDGIKCAMAMVK